MLHQILPSSLASINHLPAELLIEILTFLSPQDILQVALVNQKFKKATFSEILWSRKYKQHFQYCVISGEPLKKWRDEFQRAYQEEYKGFSPKDKSIFSAVKERDLQKLKKIYYIANHEHIAKKDTNKLSLLNWVEKTNNSNFHLLQNDPFIQYFYGLAIKYYEKDSSINVFKRDTFERTILHWALYCYQPTNTIQLLIAQSAELNAQNKNGETPLKIAIVTGHYEAVIILIKNGANINMVSAPLISAAQNGHLEIVKLLLDRDVNVNQSDNNGLGALSFAAHKGYLEIVKLLLDKGANVNQSERNNFSALSFAIQEGHLEIVKVLLAHGADVNQTTKIGSTALMLAVKQGHLEVIKTLLATHGININGSDKYGFSALSLAAQKGHLEMVKVLLAHNADVNQATKKGSTPLILAVEQDHLEVTEILLANGAKVNYVSFKGYTPIFYSIAQNQCDISQLLIRYGAKNEIILCLPLEELGELGNDPLILAKLYHPEQTIVSISAFEVEQIICKKCNNNHEESLILTSFAKSEMERLKNQLYAINMKFAAYKNTHLGDYLFLLHQEIQSILNTTLDKNDALAECQNYQNLLQKIKKHFEKQPFNLFTLFSPNKEWLKLREEIYLILKSANQNINNAQAVVNTQRLTFKNN
jgi:ankyrin repeat protein